MNNKELYNKLRIVALVLMAISVALGAYMTFKSSQKKNTDANKFSKEYPSVKEDNMFAYMSLKDANEALLKERGVFFFCTRTKDNCDKYALYLYEEAKDLNYSPIYYIDMKDTSEEDINKLKELTTNSDYPLIVIADKGVKEKVNIIYNKWDDTDVESFKIEVMNKINLVNDSMCQEEC